VSKIYILAGTYEQFKTFRHQLAELMIESGVGCTTGDFVYLDSCEKLLGCYKPWGYKVGTWSERNDIEELNLMLLARQSSLDEFIEVLL